VSESYARKLWTRHELQQAQARAFRENREYILPLRIDDTEIPGLNATIGYIDLRRIPMADIHGIVLKKLFGDEADYLDPEELTWRGELVDFRGMQVASFWPEKFRKAQEEREYVVRRELSRIPYGNERNPWDTNVPCHDCGALPGELHVPGCDVEECPGCGEQALSCDCDLE
jgi:hypothetical protein